MGKGAMGQGKGQVRVAPSVGEGWGVGALGVQSVSHWVCKQEDNTGTQGLAGGMRRCRRPYYRINGETQLGPRPARL